MRSGIAGVLLRLEMLRYILFVEIWKKQRLREKRRIKLEQTL